MTSPALPSQQTGSVTPSAGQRLLVVDDEDTIRLVIARYLRTRGFDVSTAESGDAALEELSSGQFDLMLCDVRMPGLSGVELVPAALRVDPHLGIVMLSAVNDAPTAAEAMSNGVLDYLTKPIELQHLHDAVQRALHKRMLKSEQGRFERALREEVAERTRELEREKSQLREVTVGVIEALVRTMEAKDVYLRGHSARVGDLAASIAERMKLTPEVVEDVRTAGLLHDVGNIGIRAAVLNKPGVLEPGEIQHLREHVRIGVEILSPLRHIERVVVFVGDHHERWDGTGYPNARAGGDISIGGRILAVADAFDSLISKRAFREPIGTDQALELLQAKVGTQFDPKVFEALQAVVKKRKTLVFVDPNYA